MLCHRPWQNTSLHVVVATDVFPCFREKGLHIVWGSELDFTTRIWCVFEKEGPTDVFRQRLPALPVVRFLRGQALGEVIVAFPVGDMSSAG